MEPPPPPPEGLEIVEVAALPGDPLYDPNFPFEIPEDLGDILGPHLPPEELVESNLCDIGSGYDIIQFTHAELCEYTRHFAFELGRGGHSTVYKGIIRGRPEKNLNGKDVAVKVSHQTVDNYLAQWEAEKTHIPKFINKNIIKLIGICATDEHLYLVFPFMENGNVRDALTDLTWKKTLKIVKGTTKALKDLHCHSWLVFRDLKIDNILLDKHFTPKLSDFGLARPDGEVMNVGTWGYTDPATMNGAPGTRSGDIWSLGVVILQLIMKSSSVQRADIFTGDASKIRDWAIGEYLQNGHAVHAELRRDCKESEASMITKLGIDCTDPKATNRPNVIEILKVISAIEGKKMKKLAKKFTKSIMA